MLLFSFEIPISLWCQLIMFFFRSTSGGLWLYLCQLNHNEASRALLIPRTRLSGCDVYNALD